MSRDEVMDVQRFFTKEPIEIQDSKSCPIWGDLSQRVLIKAEKESNNMSMYKAQQRRVVTIQFFDDDAGLPVEDSLVLEIPSVVTEDNNETTIQQALLDYDVAQHIHNHNKVREGIVNESILERTGQKVMLRPIQLKNLRIVVV